MSRLLGVKTSTAYNNGADLRAQQQKLRSQEVYSSSSAADIMASLPRQKAENGYTEVMESGVNLINRMSFYSFLLKVKERSSQNTKMLDIVSPIQAAIGNLSVSSPKYKFMPEDIIADNRKGTLDVSKDYINDVNRIFTLYDEITSNTMQQRLPGTLAEATTILYDALNRKDVYGNRGIDILLSTKLLTEREYSAVNKLLMPGADALNLSPAMIVANLDLALSVNKILAKELERKDTTSNASSMNMDMVIPELYINLMNNISDAKTPAEIEARIANTFKNSKLLPNNFNYEDYMKDTKFARIASVASDYIRPAGGVSNNTFINNTFTTANTTTNSGYGLLDDSNGQGMIMSARGVSTIPDYRNDASQAVEVVNVDAFGRISNTVSNYNTSNYSTANNNTLIPRADEITGEFYDEVKKGKNLGGIASFKISNAPSVENSHIEYFGDGSSVEVLHITTAIGNERYMTFEIPKKQSTAVRSRVMGNAQQASGHSYTTANPVRHNTGHTINLDTGTYGNKFVGTEGLHTVTIASINEMQIHLESGTPVEKERFNTDFIPPLGGNLVINFVGGGYAAYDRNKNAWLTSEPVSVSSQSPYVHELRNNASTYNTGKSLKSVLEDKRALELGSAYGVVSQNPDYSAIAANDRAGYDKAFDLMETARRAPLITLCGEKVYECASPTPTFDGVFYSPEKDLYYNNDGSVYINQQAVEEEYKFRAVHRKRTPAKIFNVIAGTHGFVEYNKPAAGLFSTGQGTTSYSTASAVGGYGSLQSDTATIRNVVQTSNTLVDRSKEKVMYINLKD